MRNLILGATALTVMLWAPTTANAEVGDPLVLSVTPDEPAGSGDVVGVDLTEGRLFDLALMFGGFESGAVPLGDIELDIVPSLVVPLGLFPADGAISFAETLPDDLPPDLSGTVILLQAVSVGLNDDFTDLLWRESNVDELAFE